MFKKILRQSQPNFQHYVKKVEAQTKKNCFLLKKHVVKRYIK